MRYLMLEALEREHEVIAEAIERHYDARTGTFLGLDATQYHTNQDMEESYLVVYDSDAEPVYRSPLTYQITLPVAPVKEKRRFKSIISHPIDKMPIYRTNEETNVRFLTVSRKLHAGQRSVGWMVIATPIGDIRDAVRQLFRTMLVGILLLSLVAAVWSNILTRKSLKPITAITSTARRLSSTNLEERLGVSTADDEIDQLARILNELLDRLQRAFESQQRFVSNGAHELKTPLTILRTHWEDELNNPELPLENREKIAGDIETISRLNRVINNLLLLSQTEFARDAFEIEAVSLDELLSAVVSEMEVLADMKSQELRLTRIESVVLQADRDRLHQLIFNLLDNAIKYTQENGKINVSLRVQDGEAFVVVEDNGMGIPEEDLRYVFDRFYRVSKARSLETPGSGLGLSICRMIAETHKGSIDLASLAGEGSTFTLRLPIQQ
jgi:heavy metal sensor kinase